MTTSRTQHIEVLGADKCRDVHEPPARMILSDGTAADVFAPDVVELCRRILAAAGSDAVVTEPGVAHPAGEEQEEVDRWRNDATDQGAAHGPGPESGGGGARPLIAPELWADVHVLVAWLDQHNGNDSRETALRLLKVSEEAGEAASAYIGATGQNPRKGATHTTDDVADELCDVILSAAVALATLTGHDAQHRLAARLEAVTRRSLPPTTRTDP